MRNPFEVLLDGGEREKTLGDAIRYQGERAPCDAYPSSPVVQCGAGWVQHEEPLNCGQLVINSPHLAQTIYDARPARGSLRIDRHGAVISRLVHTNLRPNLEEEFKGGLLGDEDYETEIRRIHWPEIEDLVKK